jgi:hypothetical protein
METNRAKSNVKKGEIVAQQESNGVFLFSLENILRHKVGNNGIHNMCTTTTTKSNKKNEKLGHDSCSVCARSCVIENDANDEGTNENRHQCKESSQAHNKLVEMVQFKKKRTNNIIQPAGHHQDGTPIGETVGSHCYYEDGYCYCSNICQKRAKSYFLGKYLFDHEKEAKNESCEEINELEQFFMKLFRQEETLDLFHASIAMAAVIYRNIIEYEGSCSNDGNLLIDFAQSCGLNSIHKKVDVTYGQDDKDEKIMICWTLLRSAFPSSAIPSKSSQKQKQHQLSTTISSSPQAFCELQKAIATKYMYPITMYHPLHTYITNELLSLHNDDLIQSMNIIKESFKLDTIMISPKEKEEVVGTENDITHEAKLELIREATYLVQISTSYDIDEELKAIIHPKLLTFIINMKRNMIVFAPHLNYEHSCIPNSLVESAITDTANILSVISLCDIELRDTLSTSKINNLQENVNDRATALKNVFGQDYVCHCTRCRCDRDWGNRQRFNICVESSDNKRMYSCTDMKHMGDLAMQQCRFFDAQELYDLALRNCDGTYCYYGDLLHAKCASVLEQGNFVKAQLMWKESYGLCKNHFDLALQYQKQNAYQLLSNVVTSKRIADHVQNNNDYDTIIPDQCYMTKDDSPLMTPSECNDIIDWAELAGKNSGWTTSRHYAVPTTDIPIHEVPRIINWFNKLLRNRLLLLLARQFGEKEVGVDGSRVYIHDAFVVRYDSEKQRHLPLHRDQSTHSFTIALNKRNEYQGGGTFRYM